MPCWLSVTSYPAHAHRIIIIIIIVKINILPKLEKVVQSTIPHPSHSELKMKKLNSIGVKKKKKEKDKLLPSLFSLILMHF